MLNLINRKSAKPQVISKTINNVVKKVSKNKDKIVEYHPEMSGQRRYYYSRSGNNYRIISDNNTLKIQHEHKYGYNNRAYHDDITRVYENNGKKVTTRYSKDLVDGKREKQIIRTKNSHETNYETKYLYKQKEYTPEEYKTLLKDERYGNIINGMSNIFCTIVEGLSDLFKVFPKI